MQKRTITAEFYMGIGLFIFSLIVHQWALEFTSMEDVDGVGAEVFPRVFCKALMVLAVLLSYLGLRPDPNAKRPSFKGFPWVVLMTATCFAFVALLPHVGYALLAPVFAMGVTAIATRQFKTRDMVPALCIVVAIYLVFAYLLKVPVPQGKLFF